MKKIHFKRWQMKKLLIWFIAVVTLGGGYICYATHSLYSDKTAEKRYWNRAMEEVDEELGTNDLSQIYPNATQVYTGTYLESIREINMQGSCFRVITSVWFRWKGDNSLDMIHNFHVYNGSINSLSVVKDEVVDGWHYQRARADITVNKDFRTVRFPMESHQLRYYIEPDHSADRVVLMEDGDNSAINGNISVPGFYVVRNDCAVRAVAYDTSYGEPNAENDVTSEFMSQVELNRTGLGLYAKCFIALFVTSLWVFITMLLCTFHRVDPLSMIPAALFGTVVNIMVGASLMPYSTNVGLLEYVNVWGILTIIAGALTIININRIRSKYNDNNFAMLFGRITSFTLMLIVILGHILMPLSAHLAA